MTGQGENDLPSGLYIIATPIGNMRDMTLRALDVLGKLDVLACEDTRETGKLLAAYDISVRKLSYHDHNADEMRPKIIAMIRDEGLRVGLASDAGTPLISDPGYKLARDCGDAGLYVTTLPGASSVIAALTLSGLSSDRFMFSGFAPAKSAARKSFYLEHKNIPATLVFFETAPRLQAALQDMQEVLGDRKAAVVREITKKFEETRRANLSDLIAHYKEAGDPKGEIVIVVEPPLAEAVGAGAVDVDVLLTEFLAEGRSVRDAVAEAAEVSGMRKNEVYARALALRAAGVEDDD